MQKEFAYSWFTRFLNHLLLNMRLVDDYCNEGCGPEGLHMQCEGRANHHRLHDRMPVLSGYAGIVQHAVSMKATPVS